MNTALIPWNRFRRSGNTIPARGRMFGVSYAPLHMELDRLFDNLFGVTHSKDAVAEKQAGRSVIRPNLDISGDDKQYIITVELPGVDENDLRVELEGGSLRLVGEKKCGHKEKNSGEVGEKGRSYYRIERSYGSFERILALPEDVDTAGIQAAHTNGVLTVTLPRKEAEQPESKRIAITKA